MVKNIKGNEWKLEDMKQCVGLGWHPMIEELYRLCDKNDIDVYQVKEKFGGLRFYAGPASDVVFDKIDECEDKSFTICESCGDNGEIRNIYGWMKTLCNRCYRQRISEINKQSTK